jgi:hypothetical protein
VPDAPDQHLDQMQREIGVVEDELAEMRAADDRQVVGSTVMMEAERGEPSSDISPTYSPGPWKSMTTSLPASLLA